MFRSVEHCSLLGMNQALLVNRRAVSMDHRADDNEMTLNLSFLQGLLANISAKARLTNRHTKCPETPLATLTQACRALMQPGGEASEIRIAHEALLAYTLLEPDERLSFFNELTDDYGASFQDIHEAYAVFKSCPDNFTAQKLFEVCEPRRQELLRRMNRHPGGTHELVRMRAHLLALLQENDSLRPLDADFAHLFASWFNRGFLVLKAIDWHTPASILEKVIRYEAVHEIQDWDDLRSRLNPNDRRCYAFFHPATGDEPLIFVEVALCRGTPTSIQDILNNEAAERDADFDTAVFYSISNCQAGLKGISFGNFLIKQVAQELKQQLPQLERFVTLSPLPGFARWLQSQRARGSELLPDGIEGETAPSAAAMTPEREELDSGLVGLAAHYLLNVKHRNGEPLDPVARFHLGNGASLQSINAAADLSANGMTQSHGLMVNYLYELDRIEQNHEAYELTHTVAAAPEVRRQAARISAGNTPRTGIN